MEQFDCLSIKILVNNDVYSEILRFLKVILKIV